MDMLNELLVIVAIGVLVSIRAYEAVKALARYLLQKQKDKKEREKELEPIIPIVPFPPIEDAKEDIEEIIDDTKDIVDDIGDIVKDTTPIILKPIVGTVRLAGKVLKKAVKLLTFWRR